MPEVELPDTVELTLDEAAELLFALDRALEHESPGTPEHRLVRRSVIALTSKLWPALGDLLDDDEE